MYDLVVRIIARALEDLGVEDADAAAKELAHAIVVELEVQDDSLRGALLRSVALARAEGRLQKQDEAAIVAAAQMARKIDVADAYFAELERVAVERHRPPPSQDNVSLPTFLRYIDALGLTPAARKEKTAGKSGGAGGRVAAFRQREQDARGRRQAG